MTALRYSSFLFLVLCGLALFAEASDWDLQSSHRPLLFALKQKNLAQLEDFYWKVADPKSAQYASYLSVDEIADIVGMEQEHLSTIESWLKEVGARDVKVSRSRDFIRASVPDIWAKRLLALANPHQKRTVKTHLIPTHIRNSFDTIVSPRKQMNTLSRRRAPSFHVPRPVRGKKAGIVGDPNKQKMSYGMPTNLSATNPDNRQMVWGPGTFGFSKDDLQQFYNDFDIPNSVDLLHQEGYEGVPGGDNFGEGTLDVTYISSMGLGVNTTAYNTNNTQSTEEGLGFGYALFDFVEDFGNDDSPPLVLSMSLGSLSYYSCALLCEQTSSLSNGKYSFDYCMHYLSHTQRQVCMYDSAAQLDRISTEFMKIGLRGTTLLAATGDGGSHFSFQPFSGANPMVKLLNDVSCKYNFPTFPAESPYVIGVGGTQWDTDPDKPVAWEASGSGFSWRYPRPAFQSDAVESYLSANSGSPKFPSSFAFNASNRAYPDVSALADNVPMVMQGKEFEAGGTSASTPTFAGIVSLINDYRLNNNLPSLGPLNTRLYQIDSDYPGEAFYDITSGNSACADNGFCCDQGFPAASGWDPTVGLGSPLWEGLFKHLSSDS